MDLNGSTVAITGGARGLGAAMAHRLAKHGAQLALIDLDEDALAKTADECRAFGAPRVETYSVNVANEDDVVELFRAIRSDFGGLHGLVNNAGVTRDALTLKYKDGEQVSKMSLEQWQLVIDVNLTGVFLCGREAAAVMNCTALAISSGSPMRRSGIPALSFSSASGFIALTISVPMKPGAIEAARIP